MARRPFHPAQDSTAAAASVRRVLRDCRRLFIGPCIYIICTYMEVVSSPAGRPARRHVGTRTNKVQSVNERLTWFRHHSPVLDLFQDSLSLAQQTPQVDSSTLSFP